MSTREESAFRTERITGYRYAATGVFGYEFYRGSDKVCTLSSLVVPSPKVLINGYGKSWESELAGRAAPAGFTKYVYDRAGNPPKGKDRAGDTPAGRECAGRSAAGKIACDGSGGCLINDCLSVYSDKDGYVFTCGGQTVAQIKRWQGADCAVRSGNGLAREAYFEVVFRREIDDELKLMIMAFPMLGSGI